MALPLEFTPTEPLSLSPDGRYVSTSGLGRKTARLRHAFRRGSVPPQAGERRTGNGHPADRRRPQPGLVGRRHLAGPGYRRAVLHPGRGHRPRYRTELEDEPFPRRFYDGVRFSRDGTRIFGRGRYDNVSSKDTVSVWDLRTGRRLVAWTGKYAVDAHALAADNRSLLVGDGDGRLTLVEVATGAERAHFDHRGTILSAAFFPDGSRAVAASPEAPAYVGPDRQTRSLGSGEGRHRLGRSVIAGCEKGFRRNWMLCANPAEAVMFLKNRVKSPAAPSESAAQWLMDLDSPRFAVREQAQKGTAAVADPIRPKLETARKRRRRKHADGSTRFSKLLTD